jgi:maltose alpha-D-glucosyltransferase / alpha-amylase
MQGLGRSGCAGDPWRAKGGLVIDDLWYKNAVIYCLDVETFMDSNGDGIGDFEGLSRRLDYLAGIGVTCVWLLPFYRSPNRDNGYDVSDYYAVDPRHGTFGDFVEFMNHAQQRGIRVLVDLVVNHTSDQHPWFKSARRSPQSPHRRWYVWSKKRPRDHATGMVFPGQQKTTWTFDRVAREYYFHRFYDFQPDLDTHETHVKDEILRIMGFWLQLGVSGFRMDAVPFFIERKGPDASDEKDYELLHAIRDFLQWRRRDAIMLAEANVTPDESLKYFGQLGERLQMMLNFHVNQRLFHALATADTKPLVKALRETYRRPHAAQWGNFLRSHDELDLGRLTDEQRQRVFEAFGPDERMQLYGRGIRRRLAPMLDNDRRRLELAHSLMFALPGTPVMGYGDEIGMGDDLSLEGRHCARTPMQWSPDPNGGFSRAKKTVRPVIRDPIYGYGKVNVADQQRDPESLLNWITRMIRLRKECPEISWGDWKVLNAGTPQVLALRYDWRGTSLVVVHNFAPKPCVARLQLDDPAGERLTDLWATHHSQGEDGRHAIELEPYGFRWYRLGGTDFILARRSLDL